MRVLYAATLTIGALGTGVAVAMIGVRSVLDAWWTLSGIFTGAMLGLFMLGFLSRRAGTRAAVTGVCLGVLLISWMTFTPLPADGGSPIIAWWPDALRSPFHPFLISVFGSTTIVLTGMAIGVIVTRRRADV